MPYNNNPIAPPQEFTGTVSLPLARVKKIINADDDIGNCSNNAAFVIAVATEMFVQYLVEQTHMVAKSERKPRRNIQYKDVANAVSRIDNLEFLSDVVPRTTTFKKFLEAEAKKESEKSVLQQQQHASPQLSQRQLPIDSSSAGPVGPPHSHSPELTRPGTSHTEPIGAEEMDLDRPERGAVGGANAEVRNGHVGGGSAPNGFKSIN